MLRVYLLNQDLNASTFTVYNNDGCGVVYKFTGGNVVNHTPASFMSENPYFQSVLENSEYFKNGLVKFDKNTAAAVAAENEAKKAAMSYEIPAGEDNSNIISVPEIKTVTDAINYCATNFGVTVKTASQAKNLAASNGVDFPNLKVGKNK